MHVCLLRSYVVHLLRLCLHSCCLLILQMLLLSLLMLQNGPMLLVS